MSKIKHPPMAPSIISIESIRYSVTVMACYDTSDTQQDAAFFHLVVRGKNPIDAAEAACNRVHEVLREGNDTTGLASIRPVAIIPGRHANYEQNCQSIMGEDDGRDDSADES